MVALSIFVNDEVNELLIWQSQQHKTGKEHDYNSV